MASMARTVNVTWFWNDQSREDRSGVSNAPLMAPTTCYPIDIDPVQFHACVFFIFPTLEFWSSGFRFQSPFVLAILSSSIAFGTLSPVSLFQCLYLLFRFFLLFSSCWPDAHIIILLYLPFLKIHVKSALFFLLT